MDWMQSLFGKGNHDGATLHKAWEEGEALANAYMATLTAAGKVYSDDKKPMEATLMIFVAVLKSLAWCKKSIAKAEHGKKSGGPVGKMWNLLEVALLAGSEEEAIAAMERWRKEGGFE